MTAQQLSHDLSDALRVRDERDFWRRFAHDALHSGIAAYARVAVLERRVSELMEERERYARRIFADAPVKEQR